MDLSRLLRRGRRLRCLGVDDGPFVRGRHGPVLVVGAVYSAERFEGLLSTRVRQDGHNATDKLLEMIVGSKFRDQLHVVITDGITLGGFNVVDLPALAEGTGLPCIAVVRRRPDLAAIRRALTNLPAAERRLARVRRAGPVHRAGAIYFQTAGVSPDVASRVLRAAKAGGHLPECLRAAHLIASGVVTGESGKRA